MSEIRLWLGVTILTGSCENGLIPQARSARLLRAADGREVIQMRVELGLLQLEVDNRPDGQRPGRDTYFEYLRGLAVHEGEDFELTEEQCAAADREFLQFYHRRICWLALREFSRSPGCRSQLGLHGLCGALP